MPVGAYYRANHVRPVSEGGCETPSNQQSATLKSMAARDEPGGIEPAIGLAVIRQPVDVPMADEGRIGGIDGRPAADEDDAARKAR